MVKMIRGLLGFPAQLSHAISVPLASPSHAAAAFRGHLLRFVIYKPGVCGPNNFNGPARIPQSLDGKRLQPAASAFRIMAGQEDRTIATKNPKLN